MLPQLTVYAKIIYLLMVVISGALCTVEDYVIMSQCAHNKAIHLAAEGTVSVTDISKTQNITIVGLPDYINNDFKITLYAKETQRYLCFNENWKLVGMREIQETCYFNETIVHGYFVFRSVIDLQRRVGFTHRGKAIGPRKNVTDACYLFTKIHAEQFFHQHTQYYAPKTKTTTTTAAAATTASTAAGTATTTNANKSKIIRNKHNNNNKSKTNGMRNNSNSNTNQNRQDKQGHSSNISNSSSNINLSSIKEQLNVSNTTQQQRHHQVRHHHNDPNVVARRHQHEHKPKQKQRRQRMRARATASPTTIVNTIVTTTTGNQPNSQTTRAAAAAANKKTAHSNKAAKITPSTTLATAIHVLPTRMRTATTTITTTTMANKRKGRRRKGDRVHKKQQQQQQQQQLLVNAKDPQHRQAYKTQHLTVAEPTSATRRLWTTTQAADDEEVSSSSASSSSTADDYTLSSDWSAASSSLEPAEADSAASPTLPTLATSALWPAASTADFDASIASLTTISDDNLAAETYATMLNNMLAVADTADTADSPDVADVSTPIDVSSFTSSIEAKSTAPTTYNIANTWSADATINDDYSTTSLDGEPTPMLTTQNDADSKMLLALATGEEHDEAATATTAADNNSSSSISSSDFSSVATEELLYSESTAETSTTTDEDNDDIFTTSHSETSNMLANNVADKKVDSQNKHALLGNSNIVAKPYNSSPTATYADIAPTLATMMQHKLMRTTQRLDYATKQEQTVMATDVAMSSSSNNNLDDYMTEYAFSTKSSNIHNKTHRNRQQNKKENQQQQYATSSSGSSSQRNLSLHSNKNKNAYNSKLSRNKLFGKATAGTTAATYLPTRALATFVTQNHRELLYADIQEQEQQQLTNNNHMPINIHKNINNHQNNNTLFDYTSSVSFPLTDDIAAAPTVIAAAEASSTTSASTTTTTTKKHFRKSTQKLMATPFHQLTAYVRNRAGDIDIDNMDNISVYPDLLDVDVVHSNGSSESIGNDNILNNNNSRMTIVSGYLPTSATATLPESIRIAKIKINKERKRMLRQRFVGGGGGYA